MGSVTAILRAVEDVIVIEELPAQTTLTITMLTSPFINIFDFAEATTRRAMASIRSLWTNYYPQGTLGEDGVMIPGSALSFLIAGLLSFAEIKSQGNNGFPFQTHPQASLIAITGLLVYGLASAAEHVISGTNSVYAIIARMGMKGSLYIMVGSLASLFYI